jgi:hypothetical protein
MIRKLENVNEISPNDISNFIKKVSPFTETNPRLQFLVKEFLDEHMNHSVLVSMNETQIDPVTKINNVKHFMIWTIGTTLFVGTEFISEPELTAGVNFTKYGQSAV